MLHYGIVLGFRLSSLFFAVLWIRHHPNADPDLTCHPDADPDLDFLFDADPNPTFHPDADPVPETDPSLQ
jgi:hypothetical protein